MGMGFQRIEKRTISSFFNFAEKGCAKFREIWYNTKFLS